MYKFLILFLLIFFYSCSNENNNKCEGVNCKSYQFCEEGVCKLQEKKCETKNDCFQKEICNTLTHSCEKSACENKCEDWQECNETEKQCETKDGYCSEEKPCINQVCDLTLHKCKSETSDCETECKEWEFCDNKECKLIPGRCKENNDCTDEDLPICDEESHECTSQDNSCNPECKEWEFCYNQECKLFPKRCLSDNDCTIYPDTAICDKDEHKCIADDISYYESQNLETKAIIITNDELEDGFKELAKLHTLLGVVTEVKTISSLCSPAICLNDPQNDTAKAIKDFIIYKKDKIDYVLLGGDIEVVPSRFVSDRFERNFYNMYTVDFTENFYTDYYYSDLSNWDNNNDGIYAGKGDNPNYQPNIAVSRLPVSNPNELKAYINKAKSYLTYYNRHPEQINHVLMLSNVASSFNAPYVGNVDVDAAEYMEYKHDDPNGEGRTVNIIKNNTTGLVPNFTKLYFTESNVWESEKLSCENSNSCNIIDAIEDDGPPIYKKHPNFIVHMGHGSVNTLMCELNGDNSFTGSMANSLKNKVYPILLSCACQAATFSENDSAGEKFITNPSGGGIAYLGDASIGLGIAGGAQLMDEFLRYAMNNKNILIGDAILNAHKNLPLTDNITIKGFTLANTINQDSYEWTQKVATLLGDLLLPIYNSPRKKAPKIESVKRINITGTDFSELEFKFQQNTSSDGILYIESNNGNIYKVNTTSKRELHIPIKEKPNKIIYGYSSSKTLYLFGEQSF